MSRLEARFADLRSRGRTALIPYLTAGDPGPGHTVPLLHALVGAGADVLELGIPFSDPMADGPVIQAACERALAGGTDLARVLDMVREFRRDDPDTPVVLMGYLNPVEAFGAESFATAAAAAGVDGVLLVDMPPEESGAYGTALRAAGIDVICLVSPTTGAERLGRICELAGGFVYYVSLKGVTGAASLDTASLADRLDAIRARTPLPVGVGFGIRDAATARAVGAVADAVVVGSALVERLAAQAADPAVLLEVARDFLGGLRAALDSNTQTNRKQAAE